MNLPVERREAGPDPAPRRLAWPLRLVTAIGGLSLLAVVGLVSIVALLLFGAFLILALLLAILFGTGKMRVWVHRRPSSPS